MPADRAEAIAAGIEAWFPAAARVLPWRTARSGWAALVSEAMLQQTQVARVVPAFEAFMRRFPSPADLAAASEQEVLAAWEGLGYYRRARMLQRAAAEIVAEHGGEVPVDPATLRSLPGVGRYTAGAVASIAFGHRAPIVDGNVRRVTARLEADARAIEDAEAQRDTWARAEALVAAATDPAILNEGLMELGATVCTPATPRCPDCPLAALCRAAGEAAAGRIPPPKARGTRRTVHYHVVLIRRGPSVLMEPRPDRGLWAGLWQPPTVEAPSPLAFASVAEQLPLAVHGPEERGGFLHRTTHRDVHFRVWSAVSRGRRGRWVDAAGLAELPVGNVHRRAIAMALDPS